MAENASHTKECNMIRVTDYEKSDKEVYYELLRDLLREQPQKIEEYSRFVPSEIVFKALIIREFMESHQISDIRQGVRQFVAFERERLRTLVEGENTNGHNDSN